MHYVYVNMFFALGKLIKKKELAAEQNDKLQRISAQIDKKNKYGYTPLHLAALSGKSVTNFG